MTTLYISGCLSDDERNVLCPLQSSVVLFITKYCQADIKVVFVSADPSFRSSDNVCTYGICNLSDFCLEFSSWQDVPSPVQNVTLPSVHQPGQSLIRSGLCVVLRHIINDTHLQNPSLHLIDLLGFKAGCMKMCAEVSSWTKLCEVDIPLSVTHVIKDIQEIVQDEQKVKERKHLTLPPELMTLENHFNQKCLIHNDNKRYRAEIARLKELFAQSFEKTTVDSHFTRDQIVERLNAAEISQKQFLSLDTLSFDGSHIQIEQTAGLKHGVRKFKVNKQLADSDPSSVNVECKKNGVTSAGDSVVKDDIGKDRTTSGNMFDLSDLKAAVMELSFMNVEYERLYSEGIELTVADLILITYIYHLLNLLNFATIRNISSHLQSMLKWTQHMVSLSQVEDTAQSLGWNLQKLKNDFCHPSQAMGNGKEAFSDIPDNCGNSLTIDFKVVEKEEHEEEVELSRNIKMKHKALKPEVLQALKKLEMVGIQAVTGSHPKGEDVQVDWDSMPDGVHPKQGNVPVKRTQRKCQQLENLATAVQTVAKPGDIIVDFCSGGGHLGILCAYLLPECQVYLVENKEESLLKSSARLQSLGLDNVTLYQCNMDYFIGKFGVGLCLHACGSATDMVLELCTKSQASFVICPCCYGGIHNTHLLQYPRSQLYLQADISYTDFLTIGHAADQTEFDIKLEKQGRSCMNLVDTDRAEYAKEQGYDVTLCSLQPLTCSPKNNLLVGTLRNNGP